jgi:DNA-binding transcriptional MocR family regulator
MEFNIPLLEDDCFGDLRYEGRALPALKALDPVGNVIYINSFSKMLMPGLRTGYLVASGPMYDRLLASKYTLDLATSNPIQRALEEYISVGSYQAHLRRACKFYRHRRDAMVESLRENMPDGVRWKTPEGGLCLWLELPEGCSAMKLFPIAGEEGIIYAPGSFYFPVESAQPFLRLNFGIHHPESIKEGIRRLGVAVNRYLAEFEIIHRQPDQRRYVEV